MMTRWVMLLFVSMPPLFVHTQSGERDSLLAIVNKQNGDAEEINALLRLSFLQSNMDSAASYVKEGLALAEKINFVEGKADCYVILAYLATSPPDFAKKIQDALNALEAYKEIDDKPGIVEAYGSLQASFRDVGDYKSALTYALLGARIAEEHQIRGVYVFPGHRQIPLFYAEIAQTYLLMGQLDSA